MKPWWKSRVIWVNILAAAIGAVAIIAQQIQGTSVIDAGVQGTIATFALAIVNLILRWRTGEALE